MGDNLKIITLEKDLVDVLNQSTLPVIVKEMVLKNVCNSIHTLLEQKIKEETNEYMESMKGEENVSANSI